MIAKIHKGERIVTAAENRPGYGGGPQVVVNPVFQVTGQVDRRTQQQIFAGVGAATNAALRRNT